MIDYEQFYASSCIWQAFIPKYKEYPKCNYTLFFKVTPRKALFRLTILSWLVTILKCLWNYFYNQLLRAWYWILPLLSFLYFIHWYVLSILSPYRLSAHPCFSLPVISALVEILTMSCLKYSNSILRSLSLPPIFSPSKSWSLMPAGIFLKPRCGLILHLLLIHYVASLLSTFAIRLSW